MPSFERHQGFDVLLDVARDLTAALTPEERYSRLLCSVRRVVPCDAACLLRLDGDRLVPVAAQGLAPHALKRRYSRQAEPRLREILESCDPVMFPADSQLPDPFDGLLADAPGGGRVHACMGCALRDEAGVVGALTIDALDPRAFDRLDLQLVATMGALAAAAMRTTALVEALRHKRKVETGETSGLPCEKTVAMSGPDMIGRYKVVKCLGHGAMGSVYLALDPVIDRLVAVKITRTSIDDEALQGRFASEVKSVGRLRHPSIPVIFDVGEHDRRPFIAMEYVGGATIAEIITARQWQATGGGAELLASQFAERQTTLVEMLGWMQQLCSALACAHDAGIVHRDIKPANLMVDRQGLLKVLDFGIARLGGIRQTAPGILLGTLNYMSPEQLSGAPVDGRTDIFSAGAVFYELLCGRQAFAGTLQDGLLRRLARAKSPPLPVDIPPDIRRIVARALQRDPASRYQSCEEMRAAIAAVRVRGQVSNHETSP
ncbi:MAG: protein kinase domain-containing protein [Bacteroidales bacterium]